MHGFILAFSTFAVLGLSSACSAPVGPAAHQAPGPARVSHVSISDVAGGFDHPWGLAFLPDGRMLVTERAGAMRVVGRDGAVSAPLGGLPAVFARGQGGLLDVALSPDFATDRLVYFSFSEPGAGGAGTAAARGRFAEDRLEDVEVIFRQRPKVAGNNHWGSRLVFARDGTLFITLGERFNFRDRAQDLTSHLGKVVRINPDGSIPADNPYRETPGALAEIYSYGHRNMQGAALHPETGALWTHEHGAKGGDEINIERPGRNYGWPVISYGVDYSGAPIGTGEAAAEGMEQPVYYWNPSIAPSGMAFYTGEAFVGWKGSLLVGALNGKALHRLTLEGDKVIGEERLLGDLGERIRTVVVGPDGLIYLLTDSADGRIVRLAPGE